MRYGALARPLGRALRRVELRPPLRSGYCPDLRRRVVAVFIILIGAALAPAQSKPDKDYLFYVVSEGADKIALVRFGSGGARVEREIDTGDMPIDIDGPHGIVMSPDRKFYYVSIGHG